MVSFGRNRLDGFPYLLNLADTELGLVQQDKVLIEVAIGIEHIAFCLHIRITPSAPSFLHIVFQRVTDIIVNHQTYVFLVNPHSESRSGNNHFYLTTHEGILVLNFVCRLHLAVVGQCPYAVSFQMFCQISGAAGSGYIDYRRTVMPQNQRAQQVIFLICSISVKYGIAQVFSFSIGCKYLQLYTKFRPKVVTNIADNLLFGCCGKTRNGDRLSLMFLFL